MLTIYDYMMLYSTTVIWTIMMVNCVLIFGGFLYYTKINNYLPDDLEEYPFVSIMVPAHNEAVVIERTVRSLLELDYARDRYEIIVINDNSSDNSKEILENLQKQYPDRNLIVINTDAETGGKGKSNALNIGFERSRGEHLAIYDADNTPDKSSLRLLVNTMAIHPEAGAIIGKFRTRNKNANLLTKFINLETLSFQWMVQAGRYQFFKLCTIPGTNYIVRRSIVETVGGWDVKALAEDTELSYRIYGLGYKIVFAPYAVTWEQEPQTYRVWVKQRTRWVKGNIYVIIKNFSKIFTLKKSPVRWDILYFTSTYALLLSSILVSDALLILNLLGVARVTLSGFSILLWFMAYVLFSVGVFVSILTEKGEATAENFMITMLMYFTYCQAWIIVGLKGMFLYMTDVVFKRQVKWYKTERF